MSQPAAQNPTAGAAAQGRPHVEAAALARAAQDGRVRVIVTLRQPARRQTLDVSRSALAETVSEIGDRVLARVPRGRAVTRFSELPVLAMSVSAAELEALASSADVTSIRVDRLRKPRLSESVPLIGAPTAWAAGATGSGWAVAVLDTGVDKTHPFLSGKVVSEACFSTTDAGSAATSVCPGGANSTATGSGVACSASVEGCDHGTHLAGIAAGTGASFSGVAKNASIISIQVYSRIDSAGFCSPDASPCVGAFDSDVIAGLNRVYALRNSFNIGAALVALGSGSFTSSCDASVPDYKTAIDQLRGVNIPTVISSGNGSSATAMEAPACVSTAVSVGATTKNDQLATYTNRNAQLSLVAPGTAIYSPEPGGAFSFFTGTSMAAAHVAGAWTLMRQRTPSASVSSILTAFRNTGEPVADPIRGGTLPRIDVAAALGGQAMTFDRILTELPDFDASNTADILWKNVVSPGSYAFWLMNGASAIQTAVFGAATDWQMFDFGDMNGDQHSDIIWRSASTGSLVIWFIDGVSVTGFGSFAAPAGWEIRAVKDVNGDGRDDLIWEHPTTHRAAIWFMNGATLVSSAVFDVGSEWTLAGAADLNGDGRSDLIWRSQVTGALAIWFMNGATMVSSAVIPVGAGWDLVATADGNGDGKADFYWRNQSTGALAMWFMNGGTVQSTAVFGIGTGWDVVAVGDLNGDNRADIFWRSPSTDSLAYWFMNGGTTLSTHAFSVGSAWQPLVPE
jgi:hypothetical protein